MYQNWYTKGEEMTLQKELEKVMDGLQTKAQSNRTNIYGICQSSSWDGYSMARSQMAKAIIDTLVKRLPKEKKEEFVEGYIEGEQDGYNSYRAELLELLDRKNESKEYGK